MSKSNKYKIHYNITNNSIFKWRIAIKKLNLILAYKHHDKWGKHFYNNNFNFAKSSKILNNFLIEPDLINMIKSNDELSQNVAFEILNNRLNDRTKSNTT